MFQFDGSPDIETDVLVEPIYFYPLFVDNEVVQLMANETNLNAAQIIQGNALSGDKV